jgi:peptidoglycan-associated lipoprotein
MKGFVAALPWCFLALLFLFAGCATHAGSIGGQEQADSTKPGTTEQVVAPQVKEILPEDLKGVGGGRNIPIGSSAAFSIKENGESESRFLDVPFDFDQSVLRSDALTIVEANVKRIKKEEKLKRIVLEGRGDEIGTTAYNLVLGERRAARVKQYLEQLEPTALSVDVRSYGKDRPLCVEHSAECRQQNRSVRFTIVK